MAWDNPFPTFNPKKKPNRKNHSSLDKDIGNLKLHQTHPAESRPHTSQGTRSQTDSRPSTAHGYRQPDRDPLPSPAIPQQQQPPMSPLRKDHPKGYDRGYASDSHGGRSGQAMGPIRPGLNLDHPNSFDQTTNGLRNQAFAELEQPVQRSMTMPDNISPNELQRSVPSLSATRPHWPELATPNHISGQRVRPPPVSNLDSTQFAPVATRSRSHEAGHPAVHDGRFYQDQHVDNQTYEQQHPYEQVLPRHEGIKRPLGADVPRFSAIAAPPSEKYEDHLEPVQNPTSAQPAYTKKTYQPLQQIQAQSTQIRGQRRINRDDQTPQSPFAEFQFDLPHNQRNEPDGQNASTRPRPIPGHEGAQQPFVGSSQYNQYQEAFGYEDSRPLQQGQRPSAQHPPRNTSRMQPQLRSASDADQNMPQENPLRQERSFSEAQHQLPGSQDRFHDRARREGPQYGQATYEPPSYTSRGQTPSMGSYRDANHQQHDNESRPARVPEDLAWKSYDYDAGQPPSVGASTHPPPVRHYDQQATSGPALGSLNRPTGPRSPDSLPLHPTPVRPGLMNNNGADVTRGSQDGRGQQQQRTATPQQPAVSSTAAVSSSVDGKQKSPPVTLQELSSLQHQVRTNPTDHATALKFAKKLVEAASVLANDGGKADTKTTARNREKYVLDAHKLLKKLVGAGYPEAMFYLADCHGQGKLGLEVDPREAFNLYQSAAKLNHPPSAYRVAVCCEMGAEEGGGTRRDPLKAMQWYKRAATLGDTPAMYKMGMILLKGLLGQQKNPREALSWLKRAAERADEDNPHALHELGLLYESAAPNDAIIRDETYSRQLFTQAAELGYKYSQFRLGSAYEYGMLGCPVDARQSIAWYSRAAAQGEHQSELALSGWYLTGAEGLIQQSDTEAYLWARKAASSGLAKAEYAMGYFTEVGIGSPANLEEAKRWYWRAACELRENAPILNEFDC